MNSNGRTKLAALGTLALAAISLNTVIGSGIFYLPADLARDLGIWSPLAFLACAFLLLPVAFATAELAGMFRQNGGVYVYGKQAFGDAVGCSMGMSSYASIVLALATVAVAVPGQIAELWPDANHPVIARLIALVIVLVLGAVNVIGLRPASWTLNTLALIKVGALFVFCIAGIFLFAPAQGATTTATEFSVAGPVVFGLFALAGFEMAAIPAADAAQPQRSVPRAVIGALFGTALLYALIQWVALGILGADALGASARPLADAARVILGTNAASLMAILGTLSMVGLCAAMALSGPRLLEAMAEDGFLPASLTRRSEQSSPRTGVLFTTALAAALVLVFEFRSLLNFTSITLIVQYLVTCLGVLVLRYRAPHLPRTFRVPALAMMMPLAVLALAAVLLTMAPMDFVVAALVLLAGGGLPFIARVARRRRPPTLLPSASK